MCLPNHDTNLYKILFNFGRASYMWFEELNGLNIILGDFLFLYVDDYWILLMYNKWAMVGCWFA